MNTRFLFVVALLSVQLVVPDTIDCDNGDRYNGKVLSMDERKVTLQNDITGTLTIPRNRIVSISFREQGVAQNKPKVPTGTNSVAAGPGALSMEADAVAKVQNDLLATATPEAQQMYRQMVDGLMSGQLNMNDLRNQASSALRELREMQKGLGDDETAALLHTYGAVLENFLRAAPATNKIKATPPAIRAE